MMTILLKLSPETSPKILLQERDKGLKTKDPELLLSISFPFYYPHKQGSANL